MKLGRSQGLLTEWVRLEALHYERKSMDKNHKECSLILQTYITSTCICVEVYIIPEYTCNLGSYIYGHCTTLQYTCHIHIYNFYIILYIDFCRLLSLLEATVKAL